MLQKFSSIFLILIFLSGCAEQFIPAHNNSVKKLNVYKKFSHPEVAITEERYTASENLSEWTPLEESRQITLNKAKDFCAKKNSTMIVMEEHIANLPYLINHYPKIELHFVCHDINIKSNQTTKNKYTNLILLKKLLDDGTLTKDEFESEKKKLLQH